MENCAKIKVGVIGTGALGRHHARLYAQNPRAEMIGIFDVQQENARKVGEEFGLTVFDKLEDLAAQHLLAYLGRDRKANNQVYERIG